MSAARENLRTMVRGAYDIQSLRISMGNRIVGNFKVKLGQTPGVTEEDGLDADSKAILSDLRKTYDKITDGVKSFPRQKSFKGSGIISSFTELCLVAQYLDLERDENSHFRRLEMVLRDFPIYNEFLEGVRGCGAAMSGVIISEIDIRKSEYPSSVHKYAGLDVAADGRGRSRKAEHLVLVEYTDKQGETKERNSITFNPWLKTKLYVLATCFIKSGSPYREVYDNYKHRLEHMPAHADKSKGHRHAMAMRYMIKKFLTDLYAKWRELEGLPVATPYSEGKLGIIHKIAA